MNAPFASTSERVTLTQLRDPGERARIEAFVAARGASVFHRPAWLAAIEQGTGQRAVGLTTEHDGAITGWLPLTEMHSPLFGRALVSSGFAVGGGIIAASDATTRRLLAAAGELAGRLSCPTIELRAEVQARGWDVIAGKHCNFAADLAPDDDAQLLAIPRKHRAEVRKGLAADLTVKIGTDDRDRAAHYAVYSESVRNLGTPVFPRSLFDAVLDAFGQNADILTVRHDGNPVASVLSLYHGGAVLPYWGGGTRAARALRANERMYFELMRHARARGCTRFDFGRSKTGSGPYHYKRNWGFTPQPLAYYVWTATGATARNVDPASDDYSSRIAAWKRLPLPIANRMGPWIARGLG